METRPVFLSQLIGYLVRKDFPVGREWKHGVHSGVVSVSWAYWSERTFPLEGNGNVALDSF